MLRHNRNTFYCFSAPVMIATCVIELTFLVYTLWRYKLNTFSRLIALMLLFLAIFQLAEFQVCTGPLGDVTWSHVGFISITLLPALGIHALLALKGKAYHPLVYIAYASAAAFVSYFALSVNSLNGHACTGNYVIFQINPHLTWLYALYYYGWVGGGMLLSGWLGHKTTNKKLRQALYGFTASYAVFLIPATTVNFINPTTMSGIPSIMCGFAVLFAFIAILWVMPRAAKIRK